MLVLDTHVLIWWLSSPERLSPRARRALRGVDEQTPAFVSTISVLEIATALRRGRLHLGVPAAQWFQDVAALPEVRFEPVTMAIAQLAGTLGDELHGDPADRLIAATALTLGVSLVTADARLRTVPGLHTTW